MARTLDPDVFHPGKGHPDDYFAPEVAGQSYGPRQREALALADAIIAQHIEPLRTENETLRAELAQAEGEIATMRSALEPFAKAINHREQRVAEQAASGSWVANDDSDWANIELGDLRRARAALTNPEPPHGE
ncbi:hypothetical protein [Methylobacterium bullatum]|uniref:hypothetical protein n=1 Tax=Methylobacterium bullatum TaxID=570505 RepID=UPI0037CB3711